MFTCTAHSHQRPPHLCMAALPPAQRWGCTGGGHQQSGELHQLLLPIQSPPTAASSLCPVGDIMHAGPHRTNTACRQCGTAHPATQVTSASTRRCSIPHTPTRHIAVTKPPPPQHYNVYVIGATVSEIHQLGFPQVKAPLRPGVRGVGPPAWGQGCMGHQRIVGSGQWLLGAVDACVVVLDTIKDLCTSLDCTQSGMNSWSVTHMLRCLHARLYSVCACAWCLCR